MKNIVYFIALFFPILGFNQSIINGNFESWSSTSYDVLGNTFSTNPESIQRCAKLSVSKSTDAHGGNYAMLIQTVSNSTDTVGGGFVNGNPNGANITGGTPYSGQVLDITGYYKYSTPGNDSGGVLISFKKGGKVIFYRLYALAAASSYTKFDIKVNLAVSCDSFILGAVSSYQIVSNSKNSHPVSGSTLYLDDIVFTGSTTLPTVPDGDFETWNTANFEQPDGWFLEGNNFQKSTNHYKGSYSILMFNSTSNGGSNTMGVDNGSSNKHGGFKGRPFTNQVDTLIGYYMYYPKGNDTASVTVAFSKNGKPFFMTSKKLIAANNWTYFELPFSVGTAPDTLFIQARTSNFPGHDSTVLYLDELQLKSAPLFTGIKENVSNYTQVNVYPNPAQGSINFNFGNTVINNSTLRIYNSTGQIIYTQIINHQNGKNNYEIKIANWINGLYFYELETESGLLNGKFIKN